MNTPEIQAPTCQAFLRLADPLVVVAVCCTVSFLFHGLRNISACFAFMKQIPVVPKKRKKKRERLRSQADWNPCLPLSTMNCFCCPPSSQTSSSQAESLPGRVQPGGGSASLAVSLTPLQCPSRCGRVFLRLFFALWPSCLPSRPEILKHEMKVFFVKYNDPIYVKLEKLDIMIRLASQANIAQVSECWPAPSPVPTCLGLCAS